MFYNTHGDQPSVAADCVELDFGSPAPDRRARLGSASHGSWFRPRRSPDRSAAPRPRDAPSSYRLPTWPVRRSPAFRSRRIARSGSSLRRPSPAPYTSNVYQGVVSSNSVTFFGVPVLAPGTTASRVLPHHQRSREREPVGRWFRFWRLPGYGFDLDQRRDFAVDHERDPDVGFVTNGLTASVSSVRPRSTSARPRPRAVATLVRFTENFGTAFKTGSQRRPTPPMPVRVFLATASPRRTFRAASITPSRTWSCRSRQRQTAGLADYGTRLKATFNNIPAGVRIFVSTANVSTPLTSRSRPRQSSAAARPTPAPPMVMPSWSTVKPLQRRQLASGFFPLDHRNRQRPEQRQRADRGSADHQRQRYSPCGKS